MGEKGKSCYNRAMKEERYVNLCLMRRDNGKILTPVRSTTKRIFPDCYDFSVGGGVEPGETNDEAIRREMMEELHLKNDIEHIKTITRISGNTKIISALYFGILDKEIDGFEPREIKELQYKSLAELGRLLRTDRNKFDDDYELAFEALLGFLKSRS